MRILCVGLSHKTAPLAIRERLAMDGPRAEAALGQLGDIWPAAQVLLLSTCNRTELYCVRPMHAGPDGRWLRTWLLQQARPPTDDRLPACLYELADQRAVEHLYAVACGLDSMVSGEVQVLSQLKGAYEMSRRAGCCGALLHPLVQEALHVAKHVHSQALLGRGRRSVASVAVDLASDVLGPLAGKCALGVGAGEMSRLVLRRLARAGVGPILLASRSADRAAALAREGGAELIAMDRLGEHLGRADLVLSCAGSGTTTIEVATLDAARRYQPHRPLLLMDLAVPRDVDAAAGELPNVHLYNLDDLQRLAESGSSAGDGQRERAADIIRQHVQLRMPCLAISRIAPTVEALYGRLEQLMREELEAAAGRLGSGGSASAGENSVPGCKEHDVPGQCPGLAGGTCGVPFARPPCGSQPEQAGGSKPAPRIAESQRTQQVFERAMRRLVRRLMHPLAINLRRAAATPQAGEYLRIVRELFGLDETGL